MKKQLSLILATLVTLSLNAVNIGVDTNKSGNSSELIITFDAAPNELIYKDHLHITADHPDIVLKKWDVNIPAQSVYDPATKRNQSVYQGHLVVNALVEKKPGPIKDAHIRLAYHTNTLSAPQDIHVPVLFEESQNTQQQIARPVSQQTAAESNDIHAAHKPFSFSKYVSKWIKHTNSLPLRILLIFILGVLLSLTPCIYPMIPITVGILKSQSSNSFFRNFLVALSYTLGISLTYAIFGLLASMLGPIWGCLLTNPFFVLVIVALLIYCALSMFDLYDMYIPQFMTQGSNASKNNSLFSAFIFGAVSGTVASPCVSPGLALVLSIVATIGNTALGFLLLFVFGVGLSLPLLIIGTFSTSASMLPRAGVWMVEVKKLIGLLLFGLCFYYLKNIMPWAWLLALAALFCFAAGTYWLYHALNTQSPLWKKINNLIGLALLGGSVLIAVESLQNFFTREPQESTVSPTASQGGIWSTNYEQARQQAQQEGKLLFLDFWASWCSICVKINNTVMKDTNVIKALTDNYVPVSVDATQSSNQPYATLGIKYNITGFPTFLIVDPVTETVIKGFNSNIYSMPRELFIEKLNKHARI